MWQSVRATAAWACFCLISVVQAYMTLCMFMYTCTYTCTMYIVVAVPRKDSMSPARANAAPVWALQLICWISM